MSARAIHRLEKRRERRRSASGAVEINFIDAAERRIEGELLDVSASGFRMAHSDASLPAGQVVRFSHQEAAGTARVMWNRIVDGRVETGFLLISL